MLTPEDIEDFQHLCAVHFALDLTLEEAEREARSFIRFIETLERLASDSIEEHEKTPQKGRRNEAGQRAVSSRLEARSSLLSDRPQ